MADIHVGDVGTQFVVTVTDADGAAVDVSGALTLQLRFRPPSAPTFVCAATPVTDGADGKINYVTQAGDLSEAGEWELQAFVALSGGSWHSDITRFDVLGNL